MWEQAGTATVSTGDLFVGENVPGVQMGRPRPSVWKSATSKTKAIRKVKLRQLKKNPLY